MGGGTGRRRARVGPVGAQLGRAVGQARGRGGGMRRLQQTRGLGPLFAAAAGHLLAQLVQLRLHFDHALFKAVVLLKWMFL